MRRGTICTILVLLILSACATVPPEVILVSGEALNQAGTQFLETGKLYDRLYLAKKITPHEYRAWAKFVEDFKPIYEAAVNAWKSGKAGGSTAENFLAVKNALRDHFIFANERSLR